jgi:transposase, IS5 family
MARQPGLFDVDERLRRLSDIGDQFEAFTAVVDFEMFRPDLVAALNYSDGTKGGRPPFDPVLMLRSWSSRRRTTSATTAPSS